MLATFFSTGGWTRLVAASILALAGWLGPAAGATETGQLRLRCTNATSGASWAIVVDLDRGLVDALPARVTAGWVSWRNPNGGTYELERATGNLRLRAASSTGGYFLYYTCKPE